MTAVLLEFSHKNLFTADFSDLKEMKNLLKFIKVDNLVIENLIEKTSNTSYGGVR